MKEIKQSLSAKAEPVFNEGIGLVLSSWYTLQWAIDNQWGGRYSHQKAELIHSGIFSWFTLSNEPLYISDLEVKLYEDLLPLGIEPEDGSVEEIAEKLMIMHEECLDGNFKSVDVLRESKHRRIPVSLVRQESSDDDDDHEVDPVGELGCANSISSPRTRMMSGSVKHLSDPNSEDMLVDEPIRQTSGEEQDGWEVVKSKCRRKKNY